MSFRRRVSISDSALRGGFLSATEITPVRERHSDANAPLVAAVATPERQDFRAGGKCVCCPTGQAAGSTWQPHRTLYRPQATKIHSSAYDHETFFSIRGAYGDEGAWLMPTPVTAATLAGAPGVSEFAHDEVFFDGCLAIKQRAGPMRLVAPGAHPVRVRRTRRSKLCR